MGDHHGAARELQQGILQGAESLHVEVVGGLVQEQEVAALLERERQVEAVALTTGEHPGRLLLVRALEAERGDVGARGHLDLADLDVVQAVGDDLPQGLVRVDAAAGLVHVGELDGLADLELAVVQRLQAHDGLEQGGLAHAVGTHDAHDAVARQGEGQPVDEGAAVEALLEVGGLQDHVAQPRTRRDLDLLEVELAGALGLRSHLLIAGQAGLGLGLAALGGGAHPLQFLLEALGELGVLPSLDGQALLLGLQVGGVVAFVGVEVTAVHLGDPLGHMVQEVAVVGDSDDGTLVGGQVLLQPQDRLGVEVVGGLVQEQQVGCLQEQLAQGHAAALATRQDGDVRVRRRAAQGVHRLLQLGVEVPGVGRVEGVLKGAHLSQERVEVRVRLRHEGADLVVTVQLGLDLGHALLDVAQDRLVLVERGFLQQDPHAVASGEAGLAVGRLIDAGHDLEDRGLAGAVGADHADLGSGQERHGDVVEDDLVTVRLARLDHLVDVLSHRSGASFVWGAWRGPARRRSPATSLGQATTGWRKRVRAPPPLPASRSVGPSGRRSQEASSAFSCCLRQRMPASMKPSMSPSNTASGLPTSWLVRRSLTIW